MESLYFMNRSSLVSLLQSLEKLQEALEDMELLLEVSKAKETSAETHSDARLDQDSVDSAVELALEDSPDQDPPDSDLLRLPQDLSVELLPVDNKERTTPQRLSDMFPSTLPQKSQALEKPDKSESQGVETSMSTSSL
jgi:hypothetical protein